MRHSTIVAGESVILQANYDSYTRGKQGVCIVHPTVNISRVACIIKTERRNVLASCIGNVGEKKRCVWIEVALKNACFGEKDAVVHIGSDDLPSSGSEAEVSRVNFSPRTFWWSQSCHFRPNEESDYHFRPGKESDCHSWHKKEPGCHFRSRKTTFATAKFRQREPLIERRTEIRKNSPIAAKTRAIRRQP